MLVKNNRSGKYQALSRGEFFIKTGRITATPDGFRSILN
jgi:hypothetical protein